MKQKVPNKKHSRRRPTQWGMKVDCTNVGEVLDALDREEFSG
ncbi:hypothetical protein [Corynebacterium appendicis]|nr:hypothetical protein [Corynebacterium appendicis]